MPVAGFRDTAGVPVPFAEIDFIRDAPRFNCSPATLAMLMDSVRARDGVDFSASQLGTTTRQHVLRSKDYYPPTAQLISGHMGTLKHQQINVTRGRLIVEKRFTSIVDPRLSGQIDHAAIIELGDDATMLVDLYDTKTMKWYSVTLCAKDIWKNHADYAWQLNLCAVLMEEQKVGGYTIKVRNLYLDCIPADASYKHQDEAARLGLPEYQKVILPIERRPAEEVYAVYAEAMKLRDEAIAAEYAPLCADRWSNKSILDLRCKHYCDCAAECIALAKEHNEQHPLVKAQ